VLSIGMLLMLSPNAVGSISFSRNFIVLYILLHLSTVTMCPPFTCLPI
jgi:hypothetical protein